MAKDRAEIKVLTESHTLSVDGGDVGYLKGETVVEKTIDTNPIDVDQVRTTIEYVPMMTSVTVTCVLAQASLANLKIAWNASPAIAGGVLKDGIVTQLPFRTLQFTGIYRVNGTATTRVLDIFRCQNFAAVGTSRNYGNITVVPLTFTILPDLAKAAGEEFYTITDT